MQKVFITGIDTNIGKTVFSSVITQALEADYWKPIQSGDLNYSDTQKVNDLVANKKSVFHAERWRLNTPASPHEAAKIDKIEIQLSDFVMPKTENNLIIEGAGGLMVPINNQGDLIIDLIAHLNVPVILVSKNYLGSINHTLLSIEALHSRNIPIEMIVFNGPANKETEAIIKKLSGVNKYFHLQEESALNKTIINELATSFKEHY